MELKIEALENECKEEKYDFPIFHEESIDSDREAKSQGTPNPTTQSSPYITTDTNSTIDYIMRLMSVEKGTGLAFFLAIEIILAHISLAILKCPKDSDFLYYRIWKKIEQIIS